MPADDLKFNLPGDASPMSDHTPAVESADDLAARLAAADATIAQLGAALAQANAQLQAVQTVPVPMAQVDAGPRLIGDDWSTKTSAQAQAAGVKRTVLCADGYFVPSV